MATPDRGAVPIAALKAGDRVVAYDPTTVKAGVQVVEATSITHDTDLLDVTLRVATEGAKAAPSAVAKGAANGSRAASGGSAPAANQTAVAQTAAREEVVHTTARHPWLTADAGWVPAGYLQIGEPVRLLDGRTATVVATRAVPGAAAMWDLTVADVHTFAVGAGGYVVHNCTPQEVLSGYRQSLNAGGKRVTAYADYNIDGNQGQVATVSGEAPRSGAAPIPNPDDRLFSPPGTGNNARLWDAEVKLLENIGDQYRGNTNVSGTVNLYVDKAPCTSCQVVFDQFRDMFPNIQLNVTSFP